MELETKRNSKKIEYFNIEAGFDIETSSSFVNNEKVAFMYIWQLGIKHDETVYYGRTWEELLECLTLISDTLELSDTKILPMYIHNFSYEFQFMRKYFDWVEVFAIDERKPVKALTNLFIEFRDSYILSGYSLANTAKNLTKYKVEKMVGDLDYSKIRTHLTPLTDKEMGYCENDIKVITAYIKEQIELSGDINRIPMTNTGRVRKFVKDNCYYSRKKHSKSSKGKYFRYRRIMEDLTLTKEDYIQLKMAFMGGFTHSNPKMTGYTISGVDSIDLTSSYPTVMLADKFPMSRPRPLKINSVEELKESFKTHCVLFEVKLTGLKNTLGYESYLSESKCLKMTKPVVNNGRVFEADEIVTVITDVDFQIIEQVYSWEQIEVRNVKGFVKNYLPKPIIESILELYQDKTTLKDVEGYETEYLLSKGMLNSVYGMCVTDFIKDEHNYNSDWNVEKVDIDEKVKDYNESKNRFLYYPWGIWVTAYARRNLWSAILSVGEDYIYSDTDSVKMVNYEEHKPFIDAYNQNIHKKLCHMMDYYKLDKKLLTPKTVKDVSKPLGIWEHEGHYTNFKTLGAKRYLIEENGEFHLTVAGLSKKNGMDYIKEINNNESEKIFNSFNDKLYVPANRTGKMTHTYLDLPCDFLITDYLGVESEIHTESSIHLGDCDFTLSITTQYLDFIKNVSQGYIYKGMKN
ncbi:DNA polymerase, partial [Vibrio phage K58 g2]